jgi:hypothetical protein
MRRTQRQGGGGSAVYFVARVRGSDRGYKVRPPEYAGAWDTALAFGKPLAVAGVADPGRYGIAVEHLDSRLVAAPGSGALLRFGCRLRYAKRSTPERPPWPNTGRFGKACGGFLIRNRPGSPDPGYSEGLPKVTRRFVPTPRIPRPIQGPCPRIVSPRPPCPSPGTNATAARSRRVQASCRSEPQRARETKLARVHAAEAIGHEAIP